MIDGVAHVALTHRSGPPSIMLIDESDWLRIKDMGTAVTGMKGAGQSYYGLIRKKGVGRTPRGRLVAIHRLVLGLTDPKILVDHINHDTLDNRRVNLRAVTPAQNMLNRRGLPSHSKTGARCIHPIAWLRDGTVIVKFRVAVKKQHVGVFDTLREAQEAVRQRLLQLGVPISSLPPADLPEPTIQVSL